MTDTYLEPESASLKAHLRWLATDLGSETIFTAADRIEQLEAALTQSQAEVAAAYERAAEVVDDCRRSPAFVGLGCDPIIEAIRALATPDQTAALDKLIDEAVKPYVDALRALIYHTHECERELTEALYHADFCGESRPLTDARAILAASKKGGA